eukprot:m.175705 g.175705  ORF g.175705 m.175705 type:complete len:1350 (-) comp16789_c0_seq1:77-4126(-)
MNPSSSGDSLMVPANKAEHGESPKISLRMRGSKRRSSTRVKKMPSERGERGRANRQSTYLLENSQVDALLLQFGLEEQPSREAVVQRLLKDIGDSMTSQVSHLDLAACIIREAGAAKASPGNSAYPEFAVLAEDKLDELRALVKAAGGLARRRSQASLSRSSSRKVLMDKAAAAWEREKAHLEAVAQAQREDIEMLTTTNEALNTALEIKVAELRQREIEQQEIAQAQVEQADSQAAQSKLEAIEARLQANKLAGSLSETEAELAALRHELDDLKSMKTAHHQHHVMEIESFQDQLTTLRAEKARVDNLYSQSQQQVELLSRQDSKHSDDEKEGLASQLKDSQLEVIHLRMVLGEQSAELTKMEYFSRANEELKEQLSSHAPNLSQGHPTLSTSSEHAAVQTDNEFADDLFQALDTLQTKEEALAASQREVEAANAELKSLQAGMKELAARAESEKARFEEALNAKKAQLKQRKLLTDEQAAVIDKLKLPLLNMTSSLQQMQSKNMRMAQELRSTRTELADRTVQRNDAAAKLAAAEERAIRRSSAASQREPEELKPTSEVTSEAARALNEKDVRAALLNQERTIKKLQVKLVNAINHQEQAMADAKESTTSLKEAQNSYSRLKEVFAQVEVILKQYVHHKFEYFKQLSPEAACKLQLVSFGDQASGDAVSKAQQMLRDLDTVFQANYQRMRDERQQLQTKIMQQNAALDRQDLELRRCKDAMLEDHTRYSRVLKHMSSAASSPTTVRVSSTDGPATTSPTVSPTKSIDVLQTSATPPISDTVQAASGELEALLRLSAPSTTSAGRPKSYYHAVGKAPRRDSLQRALESENQTDMTSSSSKQGSSISIPLEQPTPPPRTSFARSAFQVSVTSHDTPARPRPPQVKMATSTTQLPSTPTSPGIAHLQEEPISESSDVSLLAPFQAALDASTVAPAPGEAPAWLSLSKLASPVPNPGATEAYTLGACSSLEKAKDTVNGSGSEGDYEEVVTPAETPSVEDSCPNPSPPGSTHQLTADNVAKPIGRKYSEALGSDIRRAFGIAHGESSPLPVLPEADDDASINTKHDTDWTPLPPPNSRLASPVSSIASNGSARRETAGKGSSPLAGGHHRHSGKASKARQLLEQRQQVRKGSFTSRNSHDSSAGSEGDRVEHDKSVALRALAATGIRQQHRPNSIASVSSLTDRWLGKSGSAGSSRRNSMSAGSAGSDLSDDEVTELPAAPKMAVASSPNRKGRSVKRKSIKRKSVKVKGVNRNSVSMSPMDTKRLSRALPTVMDSSEGDDDFEDIEVVPVKASPLANRHGFAQSAPAGGGHRRRRRKVGRTQSSGAPPGPAATRRLALMEKAMLKPKTTL